MVNIMQEYSHDPEKLQRELCKKTLYLAVLPLLVFLIYDYRVFGGMLFGLLISLLFFRLKLLHLKKAMEMSQGRATSYIRRRFFLEYVAIFVGLVIAYHHALLNVWGMAAGLLMLKVTVIARGLLETIRDLRQKNN